MKDYASSDRTINVDGIFDINRLAIDDSFEEGKSLTLGLEYKKTKLNDINDFLRQKLLLSIEKKMSNLYLNQVS